MSDNRRVLVAKRRNDREKFTNSTQTFRVNQDLASKRGIKRPVATESPKTNLANDRLKKLRLSLKEDVTQKSSSPSSAHHQTTAVNRVKHCDNVRKRPQCEPHQSPIALKQLKHQQRERKSSEPNQKSQLTRKVSSVSTASPTISSCPSSVQTPNENEAMEWSTMDDDVSSSVNTAIRPDSTSDTSCTSGVACKSNFFIVVDTNIFLSHLQLINELIEMKITGDTRPVIYVPWMVLEELDFIKEDSNKTSLRFKAQEGVKFINKTMASRNGRMKGQSLAEVNEQQDTGKNPDNKIIACCLQVLETHKNMILLTADINLKNKARFNNIPVCSHTEIMAQVLKQSQARAQFIMDKMTELCSTVIQACAKEAYGPACVKMPICQTPLKSLHDCINVFIKYWFPVFQESLLKQFKKAIDDLSAFLKKNTSIRDGSAEINELVRLCVRVCLFLKDVRCCKDSIEDTIRVLNNIKQS